MSKQENRELPSVVTTLGVGGTEFLAGLLLKMEKKCFLQILDLFYLENIWKNVHLVVSGVFTFRNFTAKTARRSTG